MVFQRKHCYLRHSLFRIPLWVEGGVLNCPKTVLHNGTQGCTQPIWSLFFYVTCDISNEVTCDIYNGVTLVHLWHIQWCDMWLSNHNFAPCVPWFAHVLQRVSWKHSFHVHLLSWSLSLQVPPAWITRWSSKCQKTLTKCRGRSCWPRGTISHSLHFHPILVPVFHVGDPKQLVVPHWSGLHPVQEDICQDQGTRRYCNLVFTWRFIVVNDGRDDFN